MSFNTDKEIASELSTRISQLCDIDGVDLKTEMQSLKAAILENPQATSLLLDEDIGKLVTALRKITGVAITQASTPKKREAKAKPKQMSASELAAALADDDF